MKKIKYILSSAILTLFLFGCDSQEAKQDPAEIISTDGYPTATFTFAGGDLTSNEGDETVYVYDVELSKPMRYNIDFSFVQTGGTATEHEDFEFVKATVNAFETTGQMSIVILNDLAIEDTETLELTIEAGPSVADSWLLRPDTQYPSLALEIEPSIGFDLTIGMEWDADNGSGDDPRDLADLILLVVDATVTPYVPYTDIIDGADGGSFEELTLAADTPDGEYFILVDVYATDDSDFDIDVDVSINQAGLVDDELNFPAALNSRLTCNQYVILAKVTKSGDTWAVASENATLVTKPDATVAAPFVGTATVLQDDWADYGQGETVTIEAGASPNEFWIRSYANPYIGNPDTSYMIVTIDDVCGDVTVMSNEDFLYGCTEGDVTGSGSVDLSSGIIDVTLTFLLGNCGDYPGYRFVLQL